jgi:hypothetical protein
MRPPIPIQSVGAKTISHEEDIFNHFLNPFLDRSDVAYIIDFTVRFHDILIRAFDIKHQ